MLQLRSAPVRVVPESAKVVGEKLYLRVDENDKIDRFLESIEKVFCIGSNDINLTDGSAFEFLEQTEHLNFKVIFFLGNVSSDLVQTLDGVFIRNGPM